MCIRDSYGNLALGFHGVSSEKFLLACKDIAFSTGSACSGEGGKKAGGFQALGLSKDQSLTAFRLGFGRMTTDSDVECLLKSFARVLKGIKMKDLGHDS